MVFKCKTCGLEHEEWPAIGFDAPHQYYTLSENDKRAIATLTGDFCVIRNEDQTDRFIRGVLIQKVNNHCENLEYGVWVSLSEKSFDDYSANFRNPDHEAGYFGWFCSQIPGYPTEMLKTNVIVLKGNHRPEIILQECENKLVQDYYNGISREEAERRINEVLSFTNKQNPKS